LETPTEPGIQTEIGALVGEVQRLRDDLRRVRLGLSSVISWACVVTLWLLPLNSTASWGAIWHWAFLTVLLFLLFRGLLGMFSREVLLSAFTRASAAEHLLSDKQR
jgi:hypothetical protein